MKIFIVVLCFLFHGGQVCAEQSVYEKITGKIIDMAQPEGTEADTEAKKTAQDAGRIFLGNAQQSDAALSRIESRTANMYSSADDRAVVAQSDTPLAPPTSTVVGSPSSKKVSDTIQMKNGDTFEGKVSLSHLSVNTTYGLIKIPLELLAELAMTGGQKNVETLLTTGGDRFSGFLQEQNIPIALPGGNKLKVRKEKIKGVMFSRHNSQDENAPPDGVEMRNTDVFKATVTTPVFTIETSYGALDFQHKDILNIAFEGEENVIGKITLRNNKGTFQGVLQTEEIALKNSAGQELFIYKDKFKTINFGAISPLQTSGIIPKVIFGSEESTISNEPVTGSYALVLQKNGSGTIPHSVQIDINGKNIGVFMRQRVVSIEQYLHNGLNTLSFLTQPVAGLAGDGYLDIKAGPRNNSSFSPELFYSTKKAEKEGKQSVAIPYAIHDGIRSLSVGDIALFVRPEFFSQGVPLVSTIYIDNKPVTTVTGPINGFPLSGVHPGKVYRLKIVTKAVKNVPTNNWLNIEVGRIASIGRGTYKYSGLVEFKNSQGWRFSAHNDPVVSQGKGSTVVIELPFSL